MDDGFEINDEIIIYMQRNDIFPFQEGSPYFIATLKNIPRGEGDHFQFKKDDHYFSINPLCPDFIGIEKL